MVMTMDLEEQGSTDLLTGMDMVGKVETITPEYADELLSRNHCERPLSISIVKGYLDQMQRGVWNIGIVPIAIDEEGYLINGQHRLTAVILYGKPVRFFVARSTPAEVKPHIDSEGRNRTRMQVLNSMGCRVNSIETSVTFGLLDPKNAKHVHNADALDTFHRHEVAIRFAAQTMPGQRKSLTHAAVYIAIARAYYHYNSERLCEFGRVFYTGLPTGPEDYGAIRLRNWQIRNDALGGSVKRLALYPRAESAIRAFCKHKSLAYLYPAATELFPLPEEVE